MKTLFKLALAGMVASIGLAQEATEEKKEDSKPKEEEAKVATVVMSTSMGDIHLEMDEKNAPITVKNFLQYVDDGFYDGTVFHRVIGNFMIQGGGFKIKDGELEKQKTRGGIKNESSKTPSNKRGTIAMARTSDPDSATAQFFINVVDNESLDYPNLNGYATFGKVVKGMDVVDKIKAVKTTKKAGMRDVPEEAVTIKSVKRAK